MLIIVPTVLLSPVLNSFYLHRRGFTEAGGENMTDIPPPRRRKKKERKKEEKKRSVEEQSNFLSLKQGRINRFLLGGSWGGGPKISLGDIQFLFILLFFPYVVKAPFGGARGHGPLSLLIRPLKGLFWRRWD